MHQFISEFKYFKMGLSALLTMHIALENILRILSMVMETVKFALLFIFYV